MRTLLPLLLALLVPGCEDEGCVSPDRDFSLDLDITEADVAAILDEGVTSRDAIVCHDACHQLYRRDRGFQPNIREIESCSFDLDPTPGDSDEAVVGHVECAGVDNPNGCV